MYGSNATFIEQALQTTSDDCVFWPFGRNNKGYAVHKAGKLVHRLICESVHGPAPGMVAAHSCGNGDKGCINPRHLSWKTFVANVHDKKAHGTWGTKLTEADVRSIRSMLGAGTAARQIASHFGVRKAAIYEIKNGVSWAWLT